jgi:hypothetical protein
MTVSRKPLRTPAGQGSTPPVPPRVDVDAIINRGGSVAREAPAKMPASRARKSVLMNLPVETLDAIANAIASRPVKIPRQTWIEEAIQEKLGREQGK